MLLKNALFVINFRVKGLLKLVHHGYKSGHGTRIPSFYKVSLSTDNKVLLYNKSKQTKKGSRDHNKK